MDLRTLGHAFDEAVRLYSDRTALVFEEEKITYRALAQRVENFAKGLYDLGIRPGDRVAVWLPNSPEWVVTELAVAKLGGIIVPVNTRYRQREVHDALRRSGARALIMTRAFLTNRYLDMLVEICPEIATAEPGRLISSQLPDLRVVIGVGPMEHPGILGIEQVYRSGSESALSPAQIQQAIRTSDPLFLFWTSGTTGAPKGALLDHTAVENIWNWTSMLGYSPDDRTVTVRPFFYISGNFWSMLGILLHGACAYIIQDFKEEEVLTLMVKAKATLCVAGTSFYTTLLRYPDFDQYDISTLSKGFIGGGPVTVDLVREVKDRFGLKRLVQVYGMTELQGFCTSTAPEDPAEVTGQTVGRPLPGFELQLRDPETNNIIPQGKTGELWVRGRRLISYFQLSEQELAYYFDGDGWFRTGDLLTQDEAGRYRFVGRLKEMAKVGGENVSLGEVEGVLSSHPDILRACALSVPDPVKGEVVAVVVESKVGSTLAREQLDDWCKERLAPFKRPRFITFVKSGYPWPLTPSGKVQRSKLASLF